MHYYDGLLLTHNHVPCCLPIQAISVSFRVVTPGGGSLGSQEGRTPNVAANFFFYYFQPLLLPSFLRVIDLILLLSNRRRAITMIGSRATPQKKICWSNFPGGPNASPGGGALPPPPPVGRMPEWNTVRLWKADADVSPGTPHVVVFLLRVVQ
jgi:hypothetical protein